MDVSKPFTAVSPSIDTDVLTVLAGSTRPRSGRELARRTGRSNTGVRHVLDRLVEHGLVSREEVGRTFLYELNRDHLLAPAVERMAGARTELIRRLREAIGAWETPPVHASLFGSAARGDGDTRSDVDLLIVRPADLDPDDPTWRDQLDDLAGSVRRWTGNNAGISEVSEGELPRLRRVRPPVVEEVGEDAVDPLRVHHVRPASKSPRAWTLKHGAAALDGYVGPSGEQHDSGHIPCLTWAC